MHSVISRLEQHFIPLTIQVLQWHQMEHTVVIGIQQTLAGVLQFKAYCIQNFSVRKSVLTLRNFYVKSFYKLKLFKQIFILNY